MMSFKFLICVLLCLPLVYCQSWSSFGTRQSTIESELWPNTDPIKLFSGEWSVDKTVLYNPDGSSSEVKGVLRYYEHWFIMQVPKSNEDTVQRASGVLIRHDSNHLLLAESALQVVDLGNSRFELLVRSFVVVPENILSAEDENGEDSVESDARNQFQSLFQGELVVTDTAQGVVASGEWNLDGFVGMYTLSFMSIDTFVLTMVDSTGQSMVTWFGRRSNAAEGIKEKGIFKQYGMTVLIALIFIGSRLVRQFFTKKVVNPTRNRPARVPPPSTS
mmetsp:Transcript_10519/g.18980  ORF Transcript_10519/g.18980 Transcript_10519/m.18980 type:complete len:275 (-) Transcript_10519:64-888(-)